MEPTNQAPVQAPTQTKSNKKFIIPIIALSIITAALAGFIIYDQFIKTSNNTDAAQDKNTSQDQPSGNDTSGTTTPENDSGEALDADQFAKDKAELYPDGTFDYAVDAATGQDKIAHDRAKINGRYPAYKFISDLVDNSGAYIVKHGSYASAQAVFDDLFSRDAPNIFASMFDSSRAFAPEVETILSAVFGPQDVRKILTQSGIRYEGGYYSVDGLGGGCFPGSILAGIAKANDTAILTYNYFNHPGDCDSGGDNGKITHQIIVTIANNGTNRIQKIEVNPVGQ